MTDRPFWPDDRSLTDAQVDNLHTMDRLRTDRPVIWAMVMGKRTSQSIARYLGYPQDWVLLILRGYKKAGEVTDYETVGQGMVWNFMEDEADLWALKSWAQAETRKGGLFNPA